MPEPLCSSRCCTATRRSPARAKVQLWWNFCSKLIRKNFALTALRLVAVVILMLFLQRHGGADRRLRRKLRQRRAKIGQTIGACRRGREHDRDRHPSFHCILTSCVFASTRHGPSLICLHRSSAVS